jgi:hypothetical protein
MTEAVRLAPLKRLAPSRFHAFSACRLREVFRASGIPRVLAAPGAAHLGTVVHRLLERAAAAAVTASEAEALFAQLVADEETKMLESAAERGAVPLARSVRDFEVRKRRAIHAASEPKRAVQPRGPVRPGHESRLRVGTEIWVESTDGIVGGYIDEVDAQADGIVIRDHKTGAAARRGSEAFESARQQLQLYAALYAETTGTWPVRMEIVPVDGAPEAETVDQSACAALLASARGAVEECNALLVADPGRGGAQLACPAPPTCTQCEFRPLCAAYRRARENSGDWPRDVIGTIQFSERLRNGTLLFRVEDDRGDLAIIRGITDDRNAHQALAVLHDGSRAAFFNLLGGRNGASYAQSPRTMIVLMPDDQEPVDD